MFFVLYADVEKQQYTAGTKYFVFIHVFIRKQLVKVAKIIKYFTNSTKNASNMFTNAFLSKRKSASKRKKFS